jgi:glycosyltransferase involved in cell wall biosynthesis
VDVLNELTAAPKISRASPHRLVSIVLPTYNGSRYLSEAIDSVLAQTYPHWELIVVDDCSQDSSPDIIAGYVARDPRIRSIRHPGNQKLPRALNTGHAAARGSYLTWISDDNRYLPPAIEEMVTFLEEHPAVGVVYADCVLIDDRGQYLQDWPAQPASRIAYMNSLRACFLYRKVVYETVGGYDAEQFLAEDWDFWLRAARHFEMVPIHKTLYQYRWHDQSLTKAARRSEVRNSIERALRRHLPYLRHSSRQDIARGWTVCAANAVRRGDLAQAATAYVRALRTAPGSSVGYVARKLVERVQHYGVGLQPER